MASETTTSPQTATLSSGGFARKASGLVRDFSQLDAWIYNVLAINIVVNVATSYVLIQVTYPGASMWLAFLIAGFFCLFEAVVYAMFTTAMPRSGGDYVFQSRVLGGGIATFFSFTAVTIAQIVFVGLVGWLGANVILSPFLLLLGAEYGAGWLTDAGNWFLKDYAVFITGVVCALWAGFVNARGLRLYAILQRYFFWLGLGCLIIALASLLFTSREGFVANLNDFVVQNGGPRDAYQATIDAAGAQPVGFSLGRTIEAAVIAAFALIFPAWGVMQAGEIKRANSLRSNLRTIVGAELFSCVMVAITAALLVSRVGQEFLYASGSLFFGGAADNPLPVPPFFGLFIALTSGAAIITWIAFALFLAWFVMWFPNITLGGTRVMLAMAFDRVLPERLGQVSRRTHTPLNAIAVFTALGIVSCALYSFSSGFVALTLGLFILSITGFGVTMIAAAVFPWRRRQMYESTVVAQHKILGVPTITVCAVVFLAFAVFVDVQAIRADELGLNGTKGLVFIGGCYAFAALVYLGSKLYRRQKDDIDLGLAYRDLPAE